MKLLIDECLSPALAHQAHERGYEAMHINHIGKTGTKDYHLKPVILDGDWTFVTQNSVDFRGPADKPGTKGEYADVEIHAGLICLNGPSGGDGLDLDSMIELFDLAIDDVEQYGDLVNQVLEITLEGDRIDVRRYALPE